jgi:MFS family permease
MAPGDDRIRMYYIFKAVTSFSMWIPFWTIWAYESLHDFFLLTVVDIAFWTTMIVFQIPAGLLGDRYGRVRVLFVGQALWAIGILAFGLSAGLWQLFASNIVWAVGVCFIVSGDTPFLYDTLLEVKRSSEFISIMAKGYAVMAVSNAVACLAGGLMVEYLFADRIDLTLIFSAIAVLGGSFLVLLLREPKVDRSHPESYRTQLSVGWNKVVTTRAILVLIVFQIVIEIAAYVMVVFRGVYMSDELDLEYVQIGAFFAGFMLFGALIASQAGKIEQRLGEKNSLLSLQIMIVSSFVVIFLVASPIVILMQLPIYAVQYLQGPVIGGYINRRVDSQHRSTVVAIASLLFTIFLTIIELPAGLVASAWGIRNTMMILALGCAPIGFYLLALWNREVDASKKTKRQRVLKDM